MFSWFVGDYIYAFISAVVLQSIDFWIVKNVTGRYSNFWNSAEFLYLDCLLVLDGGVLSKVMAAKSGCSNLETLRIKLTKLITTSSGEASLLTSSSGLSLPLLTLLALTLCG